MIIGNNFNNPNQQSNRFHNNFKRVQNQSNKTNAFVKNLSSMAHTDASNRNDMYEKTMALLNERLQNKQITMEEFRKQCEALGKRRNMN